MLEDAGLGDFLVESLRLEQAQPADLEDWRALVERIEAQKPIVRIALVGKYVGLHDAYLSVAESLTTRAGRTAWMCEIDWIDSEKLETEWEAYEPRLAAADGIVVPGGFGHRGIEGKIKAANVRAHAQHALSRPLPGLAGGGDRVRAQRPWPGGRQQRRVRGGSARTR